INAVYLKYRLGEVETDCLNCLHVWLLQIGGALTAPTFMALTCPWRSRPQHQKRTCAAQLGMSALGQKRTSRRNSHPGLADAFKPLVKSDMTSSRLVQAMKT